MILRHNRHLAYCTNIHRGESWLETFDALEHYTLAVRERVCPAGRYAIGLRLSDQASRQLGDPATLLAFQKWLDRHDCYVFTINGFPFGQFHGVRVKEQVYRPDWTSPARLAYTNRLFDLLTELLPAGVEGSVSTLPVSFKEFIGHPDQLKAARHNLFQCVQHIFALTERTGKKLHLGLEPEPFCSIETTSEAAQFFDQLRSEHGHDPRIDQCLGINYDTCHQAVEFEPPIQALDRLRDAGVKISKFHLSSALKVQPAPETRAALAAFADQTYLHQVIARKTDGALARYKDLDLALAAQTQGEEEWRIHFHVPLHSPSDRLFGNTADHLLAALDWLRANPGLCPHLEMETYTWDVMPAELKARTVVEQLAGEYQWCLEQLGSRGLA